jgi:hypothetical protein
MSLIAVTIQILYLNNKNYDVCYVTLSVYPQSTPGKLEKYA